MSGWVSDLLDITFTERANGDQRPISGGATWRASLLGSCLRRQYYELVEKRPLPPVDGRTARIFEVGHLTGRLFAEAFEQAGILLSAELALHSPTLDLGGHVDFVVGGKLPQAASPTPLSRALASYFGDKELPVTGVELKSKSSKSFWWASKKGEPVADEGQRCQAAAYSILAREHGLEIRDWLVLSVSKDDLALAETPIDEEDESYALARIMSLNEANVKADPESLPCSCWTAWSGKAFKYCPLWDGLDTCCGVKKP